MRGRLYRIRSYPGMRRSPGERVTGELYRLRQPLKTLKILDQWEEHYARELHPATLQTGETLRAWVYIYRMRLPESRRVISGEW